MRKGWPLGQYFQAVTFQKFAINKLAITIGSSAPGVCGQCNKVEMILGGLKQLMEDSEISNDSLVFAVQRFKNI